MSESKRQAVTLPDSVWFRILNLLDFSEKLVAERVSRQLYGLLKQSGLWHRMDLTLKQLCGPQNDAWHKDLKSPAARCASQCETGH